MRPFAAEPARWRIREPPKFSGSHDDISTQSTTDSWGAKSDGDFSLVGFPRKSEKTAGSPPRRAPPAASSAAGSPGGLPRQLGNGGFSRCGPPVDFPRGGSPRRVPPEIRKTAGSPAAGPPGDFPRRGVAEGPRKTLEPTLNAGKKKRRPNENETADGLTTPDATKNKKINAARGKRNRRRKNNAQRGRNYKKKQPLLRGPCRARADFRRLAPLPIPP